MTPRRLGIVLGVLAAAGTHPVAGQNAATISADAVVVTVGMTIATLSQLNFGSVPKGVATTVAPNQAAAGEWHVTGNGNAFVNISFTLPTQLTNIQAQPGSTMPIAFSATSALWRRATNSPAGATTFNPNVGTVGRLGPPANPNMYIWIGGMVTPAAAAKPGIYQGTIIVSLSY
ncbi:MAG: hypothetical protein AUI55_01505 [Gemmatimonadetes bacterium 13_1_40CM_2_70_7]|nr:MAG: hypothetical protein AUJ00_01445 [Gemmatimonadetes bacterium 13_1_40CM_3_70_6]OLD43554.1 MAG: hypothetical protein AUI55_01505 [Gemmatimonadetes bacterium 13_1_40CM_2_70_7]PYO39120.1 MAG: hypothetical protein DMD29_10580 [Gemmatimonadota bacterium]